MLIYTARRSDVDKALFESLIIDAHEGRAVHTFDVTGKHIHKSLRADRVLHMKFGGGSVDVICKVNLEYRKFVTYDKGKR